MAEAATAATVPHDALPHDALPNDVTLEVVATLRHCDEGAVPS